ncbi:11808_t:CDS:10 [Entrophospora sp. SA101]|nr:8080_t:CDS:10 [Entrophospora sp. SA101]CAJ0833789.1 11808_t:CDS:10 [Entrophospora sp. SA101]
MATFRNTIKRSLLISNQITLLYSPYSRRNSGLLTERLINFSKRAYNNSYIGGSGSGGGPMGDDSAIFASPEFRNQPRLPRNTIVNFVPQQEAWIVERFGKFDRLLEPGLAIVIPFLERIKYVKSLKEICLNIPAQSAITQDNVTLVLDGVLYFKIIDPYKASYGVEDAEYAIAQLAQTTMRAEIGQMTLDRTLAERAHLNANIVDAINSAADAWGIRCLRYEIRDIHPPAKVVESMHSQVSAERSKRASILESEGQRQAAINVAEGSKQSVILASEAQKSEQINRAIGEAEAILLRAKATAEGIRQISNAINESSRGTDAVTLTVAERYVDAFAQLAKKGNTIIVPASAGDAGSMIAQALSIFQTVSKSHNYQQLPTTLTSPSPPEEINPSANE